MKMNDITNEQWDLRYEHYIGTKEEWIFKKLSNKVEYIREKDLADITAYIEDLKGYLKHRSEMFKDLLDGGVLQIQNKDETPLELKLDWVAKGYTDEEGSFILVSKERS